MSTGSKTLGFVGKVLLILFAIGFIATLIKEDTSSSKTTLTNGSSKSQATDYVGRIKPYAHDPYTADQYPKTVAQFRPRLAEIERHRKAALWKAINTGRCDVATNVQLSTKSTLSHLIYWVDCLNGTKYKRFWFDEDDF